MIAPGAEPIRRARLEGKAPSELIIVSLVGPLPDEANPVLIANPGAAYDWRILRGLQVCIFAKPRTPYKRTVLEIGCKFPKRLYLWDVEEKTGADCIIHLTDKGMEKTRHDAGDVDVIYWPWTRFENEKFRGNA